MKSERVTSLIIKGALKKWFSFFIFKKIYSAGREAKKTGADFCAALKAKIGGLYYLSRLQQVPYPEKMKVWSKYSCRVNR